MNRVHVVAVSVVCAAVLASCSSPPAAAPATPATPVTSSAPTSTTPAVPAPVGSDRGALISMDELAQTDASVTMSGAKAMKIVYRSTSGIDGGGTEVSGTLFVPGGTAPAGGWPIVTVGHGTTGVTDECAPSLFPNLLGNIGLVTPFLTRGYVVVVSDFQGLGTPGDHPYLDPTTAAYNMIDAVRAARNAVPAAGLRWGAIGNSQGGQASWAAAEYAPEYGDGLDFVGSADLSPAADLSPIAAGTGPITLTLPQQLLMPFIVEGFHARYPDVEVSDYIHGALAANSAVLMACTGPLSQQKFNATTQIKPADSLPTTPDARRRIEGWLQQISLPQRRAAAPMLVIAGGRDNLVIPAWTEGAVQRACALGDVVDFRLRPDQGHSDSAAIPEAVTWLADRFANVPAASTC